MKKKMNTFDYITLRERADLRNSAVYVDGIDVITQDVSCGYAVIEMFSTWTGKSITEESLSKGIPVPFEWAALYEDEWTLHYSLIVGADIPDDKITIANLYGYYEELSVNDFLDRISFEVYENMPIYLKLGFAFGIFEKNTIILVQ